MKVVLYTPNYLPATRYGGPVFSVHGLARALVDEGHDVVVLTSNVDGPGTIDVTAGRTVDIDGVHVQYYPIVWPRRIYYSPALKAAFKREIPQADILHINGMFLWPGAYAAKIARSAGVPYVVAPRGMLAPELISGKSALAKLLWIELFDRRTLAGAAALHLTSSLEKKGLRHGRLCLAPTFIVPNGVSLPAALPSSDEVSEIWRGVPTGQRVAFLGRLDWKKGVDLAIRAVAAVPEAHLLIAGHDQIGLRGKLERELISRSDRWRIRFVGELSGTRKWAFLSGADVLIVPSINENFGNVVVEALGVGTVVICTRGVGAGEIVRQLEPSLVVPRTVDALVEALQLVLSDRLRSEGLGRRAKELIKSEYAWPMVGRSVANKLSHLCRPGFVAASPH